MPRPQRLAPASAAAYVPLAALPRAAADRAGASLAAASSSSAWRWSSRCAWLPRPPSHRVNVRPNGARRAATIVTATINELPPRSSGATASPIPPLPATLLNNASASGRKRVLLFLFRLVLMIVTAGLYAFVAIYMTLRGGRDWPMRRLRLQYGDIDGKRAVGTRMVLHQAVEWGIGVATGSLFGVIDFAVGTLTGRSVTERLADVYMVDLERL